MAEVRRGRSTLLIAHRLSTIRTADLIAVLDNGRVAETGIYSELIERPGTSPAWSPPNATATSTASREQNMACAAGSKQVPSASARYCRWLGTDFRRVTLEVQVETEVATVAAPHPEPAVHPGPWTLEEWLALPQGPPYTELVDGLLVMSPVSAYRNQRLMVRLWQQLDAAAPAQYEIMPEANVALGGDRALIPDFCVIDRPGFDGLILPARHVLLVGEIASPSTRVYDRTTKRALYAEAGIPYLLMVDPSCQLPSAVCYELLDGSYVERARSQDGLLRLDQPFPVRLALTFPAPPTAG